MDDGALTGMHPPLGRDVRIGAGRPRTVDHIGIGRDLDGIRLPRLQLIRIERRRTREGHAIALRASGRGRAGCGKE
jgi:hypothetical protein